MSRCTKRLKEMGKTMLLDGLRQFQEQAEEGLCVKTVAIVVGVIDAVAGEIDEPFALQQLAPQRGHIAQSNAGAGERRQRVAMQRKLLRRRILPTGVSVHRRDENDFDTLV